MRIFYQSTGVERYIRKGEILNVFRKTDIGMISKDNLYVTDFDLLYTLNITEHFFVGDSKLEFFILSKNKNKITIKCVREGVMGYGKYIISNKFKYCLNNEEEVELYVDMCNVLKQEFVAFSFVNSKDDICGIIKRNDWKSYSKVIAKIETEEGCCNLQSIVSECKGIMVARGDLFTNVGTNKFAKHVFDVIEYCENKQVDYYVATGILDSLTCSDIMISRAELVDLYVILKQKYSKAILTYRVCENIDIAKRTLSLIQNIEI